MPEYIERESLLKRLNASPLFSNIRDGGFFIKDGVLDLVQKQPTADVVEVLRCKNCAVPHNRWLGCPSLNGLVPPPDFYCAKGKRRDAAKMDGKGEV